LEDACATEEGVKAVSVDGPVNEEEDIDVQHTHLEMIESGVGAVTTEAPTEERTEEVVEEVPMDTSDIMKIRKELKRQNRDLERVNKKLKKEMI